ncbi:MAG: c-type cytochrome [Alphaproteobacteria bacterium]|nr:c-type cytochrome [Alphaproteobacteria bacterium]
MQLVTQTATVIALCVALAGAARADAGHGHDADGHAAAPSGMIDHMQEMHRGHEHGHDFEAMAPMSPEQRDRMLAFMRDIGLVTPPMDSTRGRKLFTETGCVACHSVNGVGGNLGPSLNAADMPSPMNAFEFSARMWRGAPAMTALQEDLLGGVIALTGQDLADLVAFAHDEREQAKLTKDQIPERFHELIGE